MNKTRMLIALLILLAIAGGGWFLLRHLRHAGEESVAGTVLYTCPMHPFIIKDRPGSCPICGMELVKKVAAAGAGEAEMAHLAHVSLSPTQMVMANVATSEVRPQPLNREITAVGIVTYDQSRQAKVTAWVAGRLDRLHVSRVGDAVVKGEAVADVYAPDLVAAQQEYLLARRSREQLKGATIGAIQSGSEGLLAAARQRLKLLGVSDAQIANLEASGNVETRLAILSPISGVVLEKLVQEGEYVPEGGVLFNVADLSVVWVEAQVYETDLAAVHVGQTVTIMAQAYPGETFSGRVAMIYPFLDPKSRTVKVRVEIANRRLRLKPDMFVTAAIQAPLGTVLAVPVTAVMDTGSRKVAWVESKPGMFEPRDVQIGARVGDLLQVLSGLAAGERVATSGGYLIDSEAQLQGGDAASHAGHGTATAPPPAQHPKKDQLDMGDMKM